MGLSAAQGRFLFITGRINDVQGALMANSTKQMRLTDEASELADARAAALKATQWQFIDGNNKNVDIDYNTLMDNGYFLVSNDGNNRVVLNNRYYNAAVAAGIKQEGNDQGSIAGLDKFMQALGVKPYTSGLTTWTQVYDNIQNPSNAADIEADNAAISAKKKDLETAKTNFINTYGTQPKKGTYETTESENLLTYDDLYKNMGTVGTEVSNTNQTWEKVMNSGDVKDFVFNLGDFTGGQYGSTEARLNRVYQELSQVISSCSNGIKNAFNAKGITLSQNVQNAFPTAENATFEKYKNNIASCDMGRGYDAAEMENCIIDNEDAIVLGDYYTVRHTGNPHGDSDEIDHEIYRVNGKGIVNTFVAELKNAANGELGNESESAFTKTTNVTKTYKNEKDLTYDEWKQEYDKLSQEVRDYIEKGTVPGNVRVAEYNINPSDKKALERYNKIYSTICSQGWTYNQDEKFDKETLTKNLENNKYLIQRQNGNVSSMNSMVEFAQVNLNNKEDVERYYDAEELKIKNQEKRLSFVATSLQTELNALQTEQQSVKSIIDKNVEKFNIFG